MAPGKLLPFRYPEGLALHVRQGDKLKTIRVWSTFTHPCPPNNRHHNQEGEGFSSLTYSSTHNPPVLQSHPINKHLHSHIHHDSTNQPVSSCDLWPNRLSPLHAISYAASGFLSCCCKAPWETASQFTPWSDQPPVTLLPHIFLHTPLKKFLRLPGRRSQQFCVFRVQLVSPSGWFRPFKTKYMSFKGS